MIDNYLNDTEIIRNIYTFCVAVALIAAAAVPLTYSMLSKGEWKHHRYGRHLMGSDSMIATILAFYFIASLINSLAVKLTIASALMLVFAFLRVQRVRYMKASSVRTGYHHTTDGVYGQKDVQHEDANDLRS